MAYLSISKPHFSNGFSVLIVLSILAGLALSFISLIELCTSACSQTHNYRLYGMTLAPVGLALFLTLGSLHLLSKKHSFLHLLVRMGFAAALGGEIMLVLVQKYMIKSWCPVCLGIGASIAFGFTTILVYDFIQSFHQGALMKYLSNFTKSMLPMLVLGFLSVYFGIYKIDPLTAEENSLKNNLAFSDGKSIAFGNLSSPITVYFFTDWKCPACRKVETTIEEAAPTLTQKAKLVFVDIPVHPDTLNFTPYNLSFMVNNKLGYFKLRQALAKISLTTGEPSEELIEKEAAAVGEKYYPLNYADIAIGIKFFKDLATKYEIDATPTLVIVNTRTQKAKKLAGLNEITDNNITKALESLSKE